MRGLAIAFGFLTRLPVPNVQWDVRAQAASLKWYPLVGVVLGAIFVAAAWLLRHAPSLPAAAIVLLLWVIVTGALHLDGLADSADAWIGGMGSRERTLAIMKDPRCGPAGVMALVMVTLLKFTALTALVGAGPPANALSDHLPALMLLPPLLARTTLVALFLTTPYLRQNGLGAPLSGAPAFGCRVALVLAVAAACSFGRAGFHALLATVFIGAFWRYACVRRLGGFTGDTAGAMVEMTEAAILLSLLL